jgi:signal transduction histidine kinase
MNDTRRADVDAINHRIWEAAHEDPEGSLREARLLAERARELSYDRGVAEALRTTAYAHGVLNNLEDAFAAAGEALDVLGKEGVDEPDVAATVHDSLANLYVFAGMYAQAYEHSRRGIEFARAAGETRVEAYCLRNLGMIYADQHEYDRAREHFAESRALFEQIGYRIGIAWNLYHVGEIELAEGRTEEALNHFREVLTAVTEREFGMLYANARNGAARTHWMLGYLDEAEQLISEARNAPREHASIRAETEVIRGHVRADRGDVEAALAILADAATRARHDGDNALEVEARERRATLLADREDYEHAYREQAVASEALTASRREERERELRKTEMRYSLEAVRKEEEQKRLAELERMNQELEERVRARTEDLEGERTRLEELNAELVRISGERQDLIRILSHDLRSPFTAIWQLVQLAAEQQPDSDCLRMIRESTENGLSIIDSVRRMLAVESGKQPLEMAPVHLKRAIEDAVASVQPTFAEKGIHFNLQVDEALRVLADEPTLVNSVIANLLSNAAKFSLRDGRVEVEAWAEDGSPTAAGEKGPTVYLAVRDYGVGISPDLLEQIFDPFSPTTREGTTGEKGTGFGMPLIKRLVERYGGTIDIESHTGESNHGTTVTVELSGIPGGTDEGGYA